VAGLVELGDLVHGVDAGNLREADREQADQGRSSPRSKARATVAGPSSYRTRRAAAEAPGTMPDTIQILCDRSS
jgi:hypothetical protein